MTWQILWPNSPEDVNVDGSFFYLFPDYEIKNGRNSDNKLTTVAPYLFLNNDDNINTDYIAYFVSDEQDNEIDQDVGDDDSDDDDDDDKDDVDCQIDDIDGYNDDFSVCDDDNLNINQ